MCRKLIYLISFVLALSLVSSASVASAGPNTVAYWRFEGPSPNEPNVFCVENPYPALPDANGTPAGPTVWRKAAHDWSGNGNHLTTWEYAWAGHNWDVGDIPGPIVPQTGASNAKSIVNAGGLPSVFTWSSNSLPPGKDIETITPRKFTIEASWKHNGGWIWSHTIVGRDGNNVETGQPDRAPLYFQVRYFGGLGSQQVAIEYTDVSGYMHDALSATGIITTGVWYHMVGVCDGEKLSLYLKEATAGDFNLVAQENLDLNSADTSLAIGLGAAGDNWAGTISVGRGMWASAHGDRWIGNIDEVRISDTDLTPDEFLWAPLLAYSPSPNDLMTDVPRDVNLSWTPGLFAAKHDVYLDPNETKVTDANRDVNYGILVMNHDNNSYDPPGDLGLDTLYFWRIDEVNLAGPDPCLWPGEVWSFTTSSIKAHDPSPPNGAPYVPFPDPNVWLSWTPGVFAADVDGHKVYLDPNEAKVVARSGCAVDGVSTTDPCYYIGVVGTDLDFNETYFWAVDEVNAAGPAPYLWSGDVWTFTTEPNIPITDPNLLGWWTFDKGTGPLALDMSGHRKHGTLLNDPCWVTNGIMEGALRFDGTDDYVELPIGEDINTLTSSTYMVWVDFNTTAGSWWPRIFDFGSDACEPPQIYMLLSPRIGSDGVMRFAITPTGWAGEDIVDGVTMTPGWHNLAVTIDPCTTPDFTLKLYLDGSEVAENTTGDVLPRDLGVTPNNWLGRSQFAADAYLNGALDDFRIYDYVLTEQQIADKLNPLKAWKPSPVPGATVSATPKPTLTWMPGRYAVSHEVYFDPNQQKVIDRSGCEVNGVSTPDPCYPGTSLPTLELGESYYWAVDEVNDAGPDPCLWPGDVWYFNVSQSRIVDDFDLYANNTALTTVWKHGADNDSRAQLSVMTPTIDANLVQDGNSMEYWYGNLYAPYYAEADAYTTGPNPLPSQIGSDWTASGVKALVLSFYGQSDNDANEQMYVRLHDTDSNAVVTYGDYGEDPNDLRVEEWQEWNIDLEDFNSAGVDLTNVTRITIGFGDKGGSGGDGTVYFDNIGLYPPWCRSELVAGDSDGDCVVDYDDLVLITNNWLISDYNVTPLDPTTTNLVARYEFEGDFNDSSGNDNHGTPYGGMGTSPDDYVVSPYRDGNVAVFDGNDDYVGLPIGDDINTMTNCTIATWVDFNTSSGGGYQRIFDFGPIPDVNSDPNVYMYLSPRLYWDLTGPMYFAITVGGISGEQGIAAPDALASGWHHVAVTIDADSNTGSLYVDGELVGGNTDVNLTPSDLGNTTNNWLGRSQWPPDANLDGRLDDFRIYNRALTQGEVAHLACETVEFTQPLYLLLTPANPEINSYVDGTIDFKDYAAATNRWLEEQLWPWP